MSSANLQADLLIIGGGINGTSIALDAAGRGLSVILCEAEDLASATSSASSKLIHGGLRYLEQYDFKLVRHALKEREIWLKRAPHLIHPLQFILPHEKHLRPRWMLRMGLWLYDHLAKRETIPGSGACSRETDHTLAPLNNSITSGFSYYDCACDDARLTIITAQQAAQLGAQILTRTQCTQTKAVDGQWLATLQQGDTRIEVRAKMVVNAAGPWAGIVAKDVIKPSAHYPLQLVKGSHIVVPKLYEGDQAYILQNKDNRIVFVIPYFKDYSLIGTTDVIHHSNPRDCEISAEEREYLCVLINHYFKKHIHFHDIIWEYSGVRPLFSKNPKNPSKMSRDYQLDVHEVDHAPILTVLGGKLTTARALANDATNKIVRYFKNTGPEWTAEKPLPGGDTPNLFSKKSIKHLHQRYTFLTSKHIDRLLYTYGDAIHKVLEHIHNEEDLGIHFGATLYECEVRYLIKHEWAQTAEDILWRRTKLGLVFTADETDTLKTFLMPTDNTLLTKK